LKNLIIMGANLEGFADIFIWPVLKLVGIGWLIFLIGGLVNSDEQFGLLVLFYVLCGLAIIAAIAATVIYIGYSISDVYYLKKMFIPYIMALLLLAAGFLFCRHKIITIKNPEMNKTEKVIEKGPDKADKTQTVYLMDKYVTEQFNTIRL